jgi:hypothetical protein
MKIPIDKIRSNPNNPRKVILPEMVDNLAASIRTVGLMSPIKVRELILGDISSSKGFGGHPSTSPSTGSGQGSGSVYLYELISGHLRLEACQKLEMAEIEAEVLDISPERARILAMLENMGQPMFWLDRYIGIESLMVGSPDLTQSTAADTLGLDQPYVSRALKLLGLLNQGSRQAIYGNPILSTFWDVPEAAVFSLTGLCKGQPDDAARIEQALKVVLERHMTEQQAKRLVEWVKQGNTPESFPQNANPEAQNGSKQQNYDPDDPNAGYLKELPKFIQLRPGAGGSSSISAKMDKTKAVVFAFGGMSAITSLEQAAERVKAESLGIDTSALDSAQANKYADALPKLVQEMAKQEAFRPQVERDILTGKSDENPGTSPSASHLTGPSTSSGHPSAGSGLKGSAFDNAQAMAQVTGLDVKSMLSGMVSQEPNTLTGKATKHGLKLLWKGLKYVWNRFKKHL